MSACSAADRPTQRRACRASIPCYGTTGSLPAAAAAATVTAGIPLNFGLSENYKKIFVQKR